MKKILLLLVLLCTVITVQAQISTLVGFSTICTGSTASIGYTGPATTFQPGNVFTIELSDTGGSFTSPVVIGTLAGTSASGSIMATIPAGIPAGNGYRIRITASDPATISADNGADLAINASPPVPVAYNYTGDPCEGEPLNLTAIGPSAYNYSWTTPAAGTLMGQSITIPATTLADAGSYIATAVSAEGCSVSTAPYPVGVQPRAVITVSANATTVCQGQNTVINWSGANYYAWTSSTGWTGTGSAANNPVFVVAPTTTTTYTIKGLNIPSSCWSVDHLVTINVLPAPVVTINAPQGTICAGTTVSLTASGALTYTWMPGNLTGSSITVSPGATTTYSVTGTGANGCTATVTSTVTVDPGVTLQPAYSMICGGNINTLTAGQAVTYSWHHNGAQTPTITVSPGVSTIYTVSGTSINGCNGTATATVAVTNVQVPVLTSNSPVCEGATLQFSASSAPGNSYSWTGPNGFATTLQNPVRTAVTPAMAGTYTAWATSNGCTSAASAISVTVNPLPAMPTIFSNSPVCEGQSLTLSTSGLPGATYNWIGPTGTFPTGTTVTIPSANTIHSGTYNLTVMAGGCISTSASTQVVIMQAAGPVSIASNLPVCPGNNLMLTSISNFQGPYAWSGPNNFSSTGTLVNIPNLQPANYGTYTLTVGTGNCASTATIAVGPPASPAVSTQSPVCPGSDIVLFADSALGATGYSWTGPNGFTSYQVNPVIPNASAANAGTYSAFALYNGCTSAAATVQVAVSTQLVVTAASNGPLNQGGTLILSAGGSPGIYSWTGPNNLTAIGPNPYLQNISPADSGSYTVTLAMAGCPAVTAETTVQVNPMNLITGIVFSDMNNNGVQDAGENLAANVVVGMQPGNYMATTNSMGIYSAYVPAGTYSLAPQNLPILSAPNPASYQVSFSGTGQTSVANNFSLYSMPAHNLQVSITESWNAAPGFTTLHSIAYKNLGNIAISGTLRYKHDTLLVVSSNTSPGYTVAGDTLVWAFSNLLPNQMHYKYVYMTVPVGTALGTVLSSSAVITPVAGDVVPSNNYFSLTQIVTGSWDPNDKLVQPAGPITPAQVAAGQEMVYTVRFQNTGTGPAVNVLVVDTLSDNLDLNTFQMLSASHNYNLSFRNPGVLEWHFPNIMLPDSNSNEPASHGSVQYSIKPNSTLAVGDDIANRAHIFFDFNEAVVTNTTSTIVALPNAIAAVQEQNKLHLFPNPNRGSFRIKLNEATEGAVQVRLLNLLGQEVYTQNARATEGSFEVQVEVKNLTNGIYLLQVSHGGNTYIRRVVVQQ